VQGQLLLFLEEKCTEWAAATCQ